MKRFSIILLALLISISLMLGGCNGGQQPKDTSDKPKKTESAPVTELSFIGVYPETHPGVVGGFKPWMKSVEEKSGNKVKFTFYPPNALVPLADAYDSTVSGMADIVAGWPSNNPGKFPLTTVMSLPFIAPSAEAGALVTTELAKKFPEWQTQFKDTKLLWQWSGTSVQLNTTKKLVKTLDDLKGMKIISISPEFIEIIKLLGANPIELPAADIYMALERGMAEGIMLPFAALKSSKASDVSKYHTVMDIAVGPFYAAINKEKFNSLPSEIQKILEETTGEKMAVMTSKAIDESSVKDAQSLKENGHTFYVMPETERAKMVEIIKPMHERWVKDMEGKGYSNARKILDEAIRLGKEFGKTSGRGYKE